jgi:hypothetical protein
MTLDTLVDLADRPPEDTNTAAEGKSFSLYRTGLYTFSHLFVLNVHNDRHPAKG